MSPFNPKPEAMAGDACGPIILLPAIASGFGLNDNRFLRGVCLERLPQPFESLYAGS